MLIFLLCIHENMLWYSLEAPRRGASNEYPHVFMDKYKNFIWNYILIFLIKTYVYGLICVLNS